MTLPDGRRVRGTGRHQPRGRAPDPELAVYLLDREPEGVTWPYLWVRWPDFRLPTDPERAVAVLREAHARAAHERVEIACDGGVGRTGTAMALLAVLNGVAPEEAVAWVRTRYHPHAVETPWQRAWVERTGRALGGASFTQRGRS